MCYDDSNTAASNDAIIAVGTDDELLQLAEEARGIGLLLTNLAHNSDLEDEFHLHNENNYNFGSAVSVSKKPVEDLSPKGPLLKDTAKLCQTAQLKPYSSSSSSSLTLTVTMPQCDFPFNKGNNNNGSTVCRRSSGCVRRKRSDLDNLGKSDCCIITQ